MKTALYNVQQHFPAVTKVIDATKPIMVEVTKGDEKASKKRKHSECAMAVACKRSFSVDGVIISRSTAYLIKDKVAVRYKVPTTVAREVTSFDRGAGFEPGTYQLSKPGKWQSLGTPGGNTAHTGKGNKLKRHVTTNIRAILGKDKED